MNSKNNANKYIFLFIIIVFGLLLAISLKQYFTAFLGSVIFYVLFKEWMHKLVNKQKWKKSKAALLIIIISFFIILLPISFFVTMVYNKVVPIASNPDIFLPYIHHIDQIFNQKIGIELLTDNNIQLIKQLSAQVVSSIVNQGFAFFTSIVMMYFFLYFMLINFNRMEAMILLLLPFKKSNIKIFGQELKSQTFSNIVGIPLIAVIQGLFSFGVYLLSGVPEAGFWAILTGFASVIPIVGTGIIWVPITVYLFAVGNTWQGILTLSWCALVMGSMDNVIRFLLAKKMADVHPIVTVLGIIIGLEYLGITGLIFGPLLISYFLILIKIYYSDYRNIKHIEKQKEAVLEFGFPLFQTKKTEIKK